MNPIANLFSWLGNGLKELPLISTTLAALLLSSIWTFAWLWVFCLSTWLFNLSTTTHDFVYLFWLSIAAEAVIRWAENTNFVARLAKPHETDAVGDNVDFNALRAGLLFVSGCLIMFFIDSYFESAGLKIEPESFVGQEGIQSVEAMKNMVVGWYEIGTSSTVSIPIVIGTFLRAAIYKRSHKRGANRTQNEP